MGALAQVGEQVTSAVVLPSKDRKTIKTAGGPIGTLRAYQAFHPTAAIYTVTYRGRTVWMTSKQQHIWHECQKYWRRGTRDTLARIAKVVGCSRATVSRFLRRLDLWRFIDLVTLRGRHGGTYIMTRPLNEPYQRWTISSRMQARDRMAGYIRLKAMRILEPLLEKYRQPRAVRPRWWETATQGTLKIGSTDATYWQPIEAQRRRYR